MRHIWNVVWFLLLLLVVVDAIFITKDPWHFVGYFVLGLIVSWAWDIIKKEKPVPQREPNETTEMWKDYRKHNQSKREHNLESSLAYLDENSCDYQQLSPTHFRIGPYDFWPSTGKFIHRETKEHGRGVKNLVKKLHGQTDSTERPTT